MSYDSIVLQHWFLVCLICSIICNTLEQLRVGTAEKSTGKLHTKYGMAWISTHKKHSHKGRAWSGIPIGIAWSDTGKNSLKSIGSNDTKIPRDELQAESIIKSILGDKQDSRAISGKYHMTSRTRLGEHHVTSRSTPDGHDELPDAICVLIITDDFAEVYKNERRLNAFMCMVEVSSISRKMSPEEGTDVMLDCLARSGEPREWVLQSDERNRGSADIC